MRPRQTLRTLTDPTPLNRSPVWTDPYDHTSRITRRTPHVDEWDLQGPGFDHCGRDTHDERMSPDEIHTHEDRTDGPPHPRHDSEVTSPSISECRSFRVSVHEPPRRQVSCRCSLTKLYSYIPTPTGYSFGTHSEQLDSKNPMGVPVALLKNLDLHVWFTRFSP